jgi:tetratricopeptide (TPR) repeat protein
MMTPRRLRAIYLLPALALAVASGCNTPPDARQMVLDAYAAYNTGQYEQAQETSTRFIRLYPGRPEVAEAHLIRGLSHFRQEQYLPAKLDLGTVVHTSDQPELLCKAHFILGEIAVRREAIDEAIEHYRQCLARVEQRQPPSAEAHYRLGSLLLRQGRFDEADRQFGHLMYLFPDSELAQRARRLVNAEAWTIHAALYTSSEPADALVKRLQDNGLPARAQAQLAGDNLAYAVLVGRYPNMPEARDVLPRVQAVAEEAFLTVDKQSP